MGDIYSMCIKSALVSLYFLFLPSIIKILKKSENRKSARSTISINDLFSLQIAIFFCLSQIASTIYMIC